MHCKRRLTLLGLIAVACDGQQTASGGAPLGSGGDLPTCKAVRAVQPNDQQLS